ncbi:MAG: tRNA (adenosine(37)-N6)-threonylcarbamoyltransferase complex dimerization subunit type 1 TsaB [Alphaproteobacteria bacterium]
MILAIDTCQSACSVALGTTDGVLVSHKWEEMGRGHAERLLPMIDEVFDDAGEAKSVLSKVLVTLGPGTFAGQRIGIAAARALALAFDIEVVGITVTELLAAPWARGAGRAHDPTQLFTILDARRNEAYVQTFRKQAGQAVPSDRVRMINLDDLADHVPKGPFSVAGSGQRFAAAAMNTDFVLPDAKYAIGMKLANEDNSVRLPRPLYLRAPDADLPKNRPPQRKESPGG